MEERVPSGKSEREKNVEYFKGNLHSTNRARTMERLKIRPGVWTCP